MNVPETAEEKVAEYLRASVVAAVAGVLRDAEGQPVEVTAEALVELFDREAIGPLAAEVERLRGILHTVRDRASEAEQTLRGQADSQARHAPHSVRETGLYRALMGKADGVRLVLSYLDEALRESGESS